MPSFNFEFFGRLFFYIVILFTCKANKVVKRLPFYTSLTSLNITTHFGHYTIKIQDPYQGTGVSRICVLILFRATAKREWHV